MNPARSPITTGTLSRVAANACRSSTTSCSVTTVRTTSTSFCTGAGLKKCIPMTLPGRPVRTESSVTESEEVLDARITSGRQTLSSSENTAVLSSRLSGTASITRSASAMSAREVVVVMRPSSASASSWVSLPRPTARAVEVSRWVRPRATASASTSAAITCRPLRANTSTMPAPIVPRPTTPTVRNSRATRLPPPLGMSCRHPPTSADAAGPPVSFTARAAASRSRAGRSCPVRCA